MAIVYQQVALVMAAVTYYLYIFTDFLANSIYLALSVGCGYSCGRIENISSLTWMCMRFSSKKIVINLNWSSFHK